jgi:glutamate racemase
VPRVRSLPDIPHHVLAFDSGIGGLGIVQALRAQAPATRVDYLADTAVFPYGEQEDSFLVSRIVALIGEAIVRHRPQVVIIACNTASTLALSALRAAYPTTPFVGCVPPIRWAARQTRTGVIGLLATRATIRRPYLTELHAQYAPDCTLLAHAAPLLAGYAERLFRREAVPDRLIEQEISGLFDKPASARLDAIGLGCTHYTFVLDRLRALTPPDVAWLDPADAVARHACTLLQTLPASTQAPTTADHAWFTALPENPAALTAHLPPFGYDKIEIWPAPATLGALG